MGNNGVNDPSFLQFIQLLNNESFDSKKLVEAKAYASKAQLSAAQVVEICKTFTFDSNRLEAAKSCYANCYDKANYFLLSTITTWYNY